MTREKIERYERESLLRAGFSLSNRRNPGDGAAQQIIRNSERRRAAVKKQKEGVA